MSNEPLISNQQPGNYSIIRYDTILNKFIISEKQVKKLKIETCFLAILYSIIFSNGSDYIKEINYRESNKSKFLKNMLSAIFILFYFYYFFNLLNRVVSNSDPRAVPGHLIDSRLNPDYGQKGKTVASNVLYININIDSIWSIISRVQSTF